MNDLARFMKTISRVTALLLSAGLVSWLVLEPYRPQLAGLLLGMLVSWLNMAYLALKTRQMSELIEQKSEKKFNLGFMTRAAFAVLAVMVAYKSEQVDLAATIVGLFYAQAAAFFMGLIALLKKG